MKPKPLDRSVLYEELDPVGPIFDTIVPEVEFHEIRNHIQACIAQATGKPKAVLALDTLGYSKRDLEAQILIPLILRDIHRQTQAVLCENEAFLFDPGEQIPRIDTGDGGFLIFNTPLHALLYAAWFQVTIRLFNSYRLTPQVRHIIGPVTVRYALDFGSLVQIAPTQEDPGENHFYGPAIINAARVIGKDKLNRFLLTAPVVEWFLRTFTGLETLQSLAAEEIAHIMTTSGWIAANRGVVNHSSLLGNYKDKHYGISACDVQQIGAIETKDRMIDVYNVHMQVRAALHTRDAADPREIKVTVTVGNQNPSGL